MRSSVLMFIYGYDPIFSQQLFSKRTFLAQVLSLERKCDVRERFDEEAAKGKGFYYRGL